MNIENEEQAMPLEVIAPSALESIERAQIDIQVATAHKYPRAALSVIKKNIISFATLDEETAEGCFYVLPRGGKEIRGPSVRLAEMATTCYGNISAGAREIANDGKNITVQAVCHDLENNVRIAIEVKRKIVDKNGKTYNEDMQTTTGNAARSIALRNAIFKVIPMALIRPAYDAARKVAIGDAETLVSRRTRAMEAFAKMGATAERVLAAIGKKTIEDIDLPALETLQGIRTAIKDGDTTVDESFPLPVASAPRAKVPVESKPSSPTAASGGDSPKAAATAESAKPETGTAQPSSVEEQLQALLDADKITDKEFEEVLRFFEVSIPKKFEGVKSMTDATAKAAIEGWETLRLEVIARREKKEKK